MKNAIFWDVAPCVFISEESVASIFKVESPQAKKSVSSEQTY
jgi:hypothetical protein